MTHNSIQHLRNPAIAFSGTPMRVLLVASAGGHWIELHRLKAAFVGADCQFVSTSKGMTPPLGERDVLEIADTARDSAWAMTPTLIGLLRIFHSFDPDLVVSTIMISSTRRLSSSSIPLSSAYFRKAASSRRFSTCQSFG